MKNNLFKKRKEKIFEQKSHFNNTQIARLERDLV